jgi:ABC-type Fe3+ transport system permease subunit
LSKIPFIIFIGLLWAPSFVVFKNFEFLDVAILADAKNVWLSLLQALCSSLVTLLLAFPAAWGLLALKRHPWVRRSARRFLFLEFLVLIPSFLPSLMVMISILVLLPHFPFGFWGVVSMHVLIELGLVVVFLARWIDVKLRPYEALFELYPKTLATQWQVCWPLMQRELFMILGFLFVFFLTSLSVPMIMSGANRFVSLEYFIYASLKNNADWNTALHFYLLQIGFIFLSLLFLPQRAQGEESFEEITAPSHRKGIAWSVVAFAPVALCLLGFVSHFPDGMRAFLREKIEFTNALVGSLLLAFLTSGFVFIFLCALSYFYQLAASRKSFQLWTIPSGVVIGFFWQQNFIGHPVVSMLLLSGICAFLFLPTLAKLGVYQQIEKNHELIEMAEILGATQWKIFRQITFPLVLPWLALSMAFSSLWTMGDFAISRLFIYTDLTLALKMESLMEQYRWDQALFLSWFLLLASAFVFLFFGGFAYVAYQKLK